MGFGISSATTASSELSDDSSEKASEVQHEPLQICGEVIKLEESTPVEEKEAECEAPPIQSTEQMLQTNGRETVADESVNYNSEALTSIEKFLGLINIMESITNEQQKAEFFFSNGDELRKIIAELEKVGYDGAVFSNWLEGFESSLLLLRDIEGKLSELGKERKEMEEAKLEAPPTKSTEERLQTNGREMVTDESVNNYIMDSETLSSMEKFLGLIDIMESITDGQQKAEFFFQNVDELRKMIPELEKVGYTGAACHKWLDRLESSLSLLRDSYGKLSELDTERKETEEVKFEALPTQSTEERLQTSGREMAIDESVNNYMMDGETQSSIEKFLRLTDILESIANGQQKAEFFFSNVDEMRKIIAELEKAGCNFVASKKWLDEMESSMSLLRDCDKKISELDKERKETEEELAYVEKRLAEIRLKLAEEGEQIAELNRLLAEMSLSRFFRYVLLSVWCVVGCVLVEYLR